MKGVILGIQPAAQLIDISHGVQPYDVAGGAFTIAQAYRYFPKKTIHVVVVDPGVGSARRPLLAEVGGQYFIAPDNGVLSMIFAREEAALKQSRVRHITNERYFLHPVSRTFHGRDVFSPVAAHLAAGVAPAQFGKRIEDISAPFLPRAHAHGQARLEGSDPQGRSFRELGHEFPHRPIFLHPDPCVRVESRSRGPSLGWRSPFRNARRVNFSSWWEARDISKSPPAKDRRPRRWAAARARLSS